MAVLKAREGIESVTQELARLSPEITASIAKMRQIAYTTGEVPSKYKLLSAVAMPWSSAVSPAFGRTSNRLLKRAPPRRSWSSSSTWQ